MLQFIQHTDFILLVKVPKVKAKKSKKGVNGVGTYQHTL